MKLNETFFGSWKIDKRIGAGSYGSVYRLAKNDLGEEYYAAMKVISIGESDSADECLRDVTSEISLMAQLKGNSNIVSFEDYEVVGHSTDDGYDVLIRMEYLEPILKYEKRHEFTQEDVVKLALDMCSALEICQKHAIVHRDIKPENIFITPDGDFKLGDFGIARTMEKNNFTMSRKGTYAYMAPEVYRGEKYNQTADIYSLGVVLYRFMNGGLLPFVKESGVSSAEREQAVMRRMRGEGLPEIENGGAFMRILYKACAYKPEDRYQSAADMREDILCYLREKAAEAEPSGLLTKLGSSSAFLTVLKILIGIFSVGAVILLLRLLL